LLPLVATSSIVIFSHFYTSRTVQLDSAIVGHAMCATVCGRPAFRYSELRVENCGLMGNPTMEPSKVWPNFAKTVRDPRTAVGATLAK
jgi:hypothetical protein